MAQIVANAVITAGSYLLVGLGFSLIYTTCRFFHLAHAVVLTAAAYSTFVLHVWLGLPLSISVAGAVALTAAVGVSMELGIYRPLRKRQGSSSELLVASLGVYVSIQALLTLLFGAGTRTFRDGEIASVSLLWSVRVTRPQIAVLVASVGALSAISLFLYRTKLGKTVRAVASDPDLAVVYGVNVNRCFVSVFALGSAIGAVAGILVGFDGDVTPTMGFRILVMSVVALIVGGIGSIRGLALGCLLLALSQHLTAWWFSSRWQDGIVFVIFISFLLWRPQGILGRLPRSASV